MRRRGTAVTALDYVRSLGRDVRANCWELAERAGHGLPYRMQGLLGRSRWDWEDLRARLPALAWEVLAGGQGDETGPGLAIDETADLRKGQSTACVAPQHAGVTGKIENCVTWVFSALVTASGQAWADFDAYMPESWAKDPARRKKAGIPGGLVFATKPELAVMQVRRLVQGGLPVRWAAADEVYGRSGDFRAALRGLGLSYVVIIPCDYQVAFAVNKVTRADQAVPEAVFEQRSAGNGTKGPRYADWALLGTADPAEFLLVRRLPERGKNQYTFYLCHAAEGMPPTLTCFITIAGRRWPVETTFRTGKDAFGWDQSQARTWNAVNRHTALAALAQLRTAAARAALGGRCLPAADLPAPDTAPVTEETTANPADLQIHVGDAPLPATGGLPCPPGIPPIALSHAETGRITRLARDWKEGLLTPARLAFHLSWSAWRRRHQARARWHHYSARLAALAC
jgi:hypothetical protein